MIILPLNKLKTNKKLYNLQFVVVVTWCDRCVHVRVEHFVNLKKTEVEMSNCRNLLFTKKKLLNSLSSQLN